VENLLSKHSKREFEKLKLDNSNHLESYIIMKKFIDDQQYNKFIRVYHTQKQKIKQPKKVIQEGIENEKYIQQSTWYPSIEQESEVIETDACYNMLRKKNPNNNMTVSEKPERKYIKTLKFEILPDENQHKVFQKWFDGVIDMYNYTNQYLKIAKKKHESKQTKKKKWLPSHRSVRDESIKIAEKIMKETILSIQITNAKTGETIISETQIPKHVLDYAVQECVSKYKGCITNMKEGKIKDFNVENLSKDRNRKNMVIELSQIAKGKSRNGINAIL